MDLPTIAKLKKSKGVKDFRPGDTVRVSFRVVEGSRERVQVFEGVVIRSRAGKAAANFTVRRVSKDGLGVERTYLLHSPRLEKVEVVRRGRVRRANLYYLRGLTGKAARIKGGGRITAEEFDEVEIEAEPSLEEDETDESAEAGAEATQEAEAESVAEPIESSVEETSETNATVEGSDEKGAGAGDEDEPADAEEEEKVAKGESEPKD